MEGNSKERLGIEQFLGVYCSRRWRAGPEGKLDMKAEASSQRAWGTGIHRRDSEQGRDTSDLHLI